MAQQRRGDVDILCSACSAKRCAEDGVKARGAMRARWRAMMRICAARGGARRGAPFVISEALMESSPSPPDYTPAITRSRRCHSAAVIYATDTPHMSRYVFVRR